MAKKKPNPVEPTCTPNQDIDWGEFFNHQVPNTVDELERILKRIEKDRTPNLQKIFLFFEFYLSVEAANFLVELADLPEVPEILFPRNDIGILAYCIRQQRPQARFTFYSDDKDISAYHSFVFPGENISGPDALMDLAAQESEKFDLIIGGLKDKRRLYTVKDKVLGVRFKSAQSSPNYDESNFLVELSKLLKNGGKLITNMWELKSYQFLKDRQEQRNWLQKLRKLSGLSVEAVIEDVAELALDERVIVINSKSPQGQVFSAQYTEDKRIQNTIVSNFLKQTQARRANAGFWSSLDSFEPSDRLRHLERVRLLASKAGLSPAKLKGIIGSDAENVLYIQNGANIEQMMETDFRLSVEFRPTNKGWIPVHIDPDRALAEYFVLFLNESELGKMILPDLISGTENDYYFVPSKESILEFEIYLPDISIQKEAIRNRNMLSSLRSEIDDISTRLWREPGKYEDVHRSITQINIEDTFSAWIDQLPFPLSSILWAYHTQCRTDRGKYEKLIHFFEALTEFLCVVHLSAISAPTSNLLSEIDPKFKKYKRHIQLGCPTFGTWLTLLEIMAKFARDGVRNDAIKQDILSAYKVNKVAHVKQLSNKSITTVLRFAKDIRNNWVGHAGAVGDRQASEIHQKLLYGLQEVREVITAIWDCYDLILPGPGRYSGGEYIYQAKRISGNRIPFEKIEIGTIEPLEDDRLHLVNHATSRAIKLLPFLKVIPSPNTDVDACYFYNRLDRGSGEARFVSYHFEKDSELHTKVSVEISEILGFFEE